MKRVVLATVSTIAALVLLLSFKTHTIAATTAARSAVVVPSAASTTAAAGSGSDPTAGTSVAPTASASAAPTSAAASGSYTGDAVDTRWGPVQVKITVSGGKITAAQAVEYPENNSRDEEINAYAVPTLEKETVSTGSDQIDMVSGATYTSEGYLSSLQSALDKAGLA